MAGEVTPVYFDGPGMTVEFDADTTRFLRGFINTDNEFEIAGAGDKSEGVCWMDDVDISVNAYGFMRLHTAGTTIMVASKAIAAGDRVYAAASGKVTDAEAGVFEGVALTAAGADGEYLAVLPAGEELVHIFTHTASAAEGTANSATVDTGLGVVIDAAVVAVRTSAGVERAGNTVTFGSGANAGEVTVANSNLDENDVITIVATIRATDV